MTTRNIVEWNARSAAGSIEQVGDYHWVRVLNSFPMYVLDTDESVSPHLINDGYWESWITTWVINNVDENSVFIDIGANTGYYSFLAHFLGAPTVAFEPNPVYAKMMQSTIQRTHAKMLFVQEVALSDYTGEAVLNIPEGLHGSASLNGIAPGYVFDTIKVSVFPLDDAYIAGEFVNKKHVIKIDAEGEEERILHGAKELLSKVDVEILLEYTPKAYSPEFLGELFEKWNVYAITHDGRDEPTTPEWIESQTDWVMLVLRPKA